MEREGRSCYIDDRVQREQDEERDTDNPSVTCMHGGCERR